MPILVLILISGVIGISGCIDLSSQNNTYSENGISFDYPYTWQEENQSDLLKGELMGVFDPNSINLDKANSYEATTTSVIIGTKALSQGSTLKEYYNSLVQQGYNYQNYKRISNREFTLDGQPAYEIIYVSKWVIGKTGKTKEIFIQRNGRVYVIICSALVNDFDNNIANFDMVINSFKVQ
jgi:hypothetical protein